MKTKVKTLVKELNTLVNSTQKKRFTMEEEQKVVELIDELELCAHYIRDCWIMRHFHDMEPTHT